MPLDNDTGKVTGKLQENEKIRNTESTNFLFCYLCRLGEENIWDRNILCREIHKHLACRRWNGAGRNTSLYGDCHETVRDGNRD